MIRHRLERHQDRPASRAGPPWSRGHHAGQGAEPRGIVDPAGFHHRAGSLITGAVVRVDQTPRPLKRGLAKVGIADGVEDQLMRRQGDLRVEIVAIITEVRNVQSSRTAAVRMLPPPEETSCSSVTGGLVPR